jgi:multidrug efflux pump subunit AcrA (membrane-fusion protein)
MPETRADEIELYSDEVQDILGKPPKWLIRYGTTIVFLVIAALLLLSWYVRYPDIVAAPIMVTTPEPPASVVSRSPGKISKLFVKDGDSIGKDSVIGIIENAANEADVFKVEALLSNLDELTPSNILSFQPQKSLKLGDLQPAYSTFSELFDNYKINLASSYDYKRVQQIKNQISNIEALNTELKVQQKTLDEEKNITEKILNRQKKLLSEGAAAQQDVDNIEIVYLQKKRTRERSDVEIMNNQMQVNDLKQQITLTEKNINLNTSTNFISLRESMKQLQAQINKWKQNFIMTAPISGIVAFHQLVQEQQYIEQQFEVATIVPPYDSIIGKIALQMKGSGKVRKGQKVLIKLDGFPYQEYGFVRGFIEKKASIPRDDAYMVDVRLPKGLVTNRGEKLRFEQRIQGVAEIITDNKSLLHRIFDQIASAFEQE